MLFGWLSSLARISFPSAAWSRCPRRQHDHCWSDARWPNSTPGAVDGHALASRWSNHVRCRSHQLGARLKPRILFGFLLLLTFDTAAQVATKLAGERVG